MTDRFIIAGIIYRYTLVIVGIIILAVTTSVLEESEGLPVRIYLLFYLIMELVLANKQLCGASCAPRYEEEIRGDILPGPYLFNTTTALVLIATICMLVSGALVYGTPDVPVLLHWYFRITYWLQITVMILFYSRSGICIIKHSCKSTKPDVVILVGTLVADPDEHAQRSLDAVV